MHHACNAYARKFDRDDMVQEILAAAWQSFPTFKNTAPFSQWFYGLCRNVCVHQWRKYKQNPIVYTEAVPDREPDYSYEIDYDIRLLDFYETTLGSLHSIEKKYMEMYLSGMRFDKMEQITGVDEGTLRVRIHRIKKRLKKKYTNKRFVHDSDG